MTCKRYCNRITMTMYRTLWLLLQLMFFFSSSLGLRYNYTCHRKTDKLTCDFNLPEPEDIQEGVTKIYVQHYQSDRILTRKHVFKHWPWQEIQELNIHKENGRLYLLDNDFIDLPRLEILRINSIGLKTIEPQSFAGLHHLRILDLSYCTDMKSVFIVDALKRSNSSFKLDALNLDFMGQKHNGIITYGYNFSKMLNQRAIKSLSLRGTNVLFKDITRIIHIPFFFEYLDISNCNLFAILTIKNIESKRPSKLPIYESMKYIRFLNMSGATLNNEMPNNVRANFCSVDFPLIQSLESLDLSNRYESLWIFTKVLDISCFLKLKRFFLSSNHFLIFNATVVWSPFMKELDLSSNGMEYISISVLKGLESLQQLDLSNNCLYKMERASEFQNLFSNLVSLENLNLGNNSFTSLPANMFEMTTQLKILTLKKNYLKSVSFISGNLHEMRTLDLQNNLIEYFTNTENKVFISLMEKNITTHQKPIVINLVSNKFICNCFTFNFIEFVYYKLQPTNNKTYMCLLEGKTVNINSITLDDTSYLCYRHVIIITLTVFSVLVSSISAFMVYLVLNKRQTTNKENAVKHFIQNILMHQIDEKYLIFISYSCVDTEYIMDVVEPAIKAYLADTYNIPGQFIVTGDSTFSYGYPILNEIMRCIKLSSVMVCFVSKSYCESDWCQTELREGVQQQKPLLLLLKEDIDRENMSEILLNQFDRNARAKLELNDGVYMPIGGWDHFSESIINLASNKYDCDERNAIRKRKIEERKRSISQQENRRNEDMLLQLEEENAFI